MGASALRTWVELLASMTRTLLRVQMSFGYAWSTGTVCQEPRILRSIGNDFFHEPGVKPLGSVPTFWGCPDQLRLKIERLITLAHPAGEFIALNATSEGWERGQVFFEKPGGAGAYKAGFPPGQHLAKGFPVLTYGDTPQVLKAEWKLTISGLARSQVFTWDDMMALPQTEFTADFHCVTTWSKLDVKWQGVRVTGHGRPTAD